LNLSGIDTKNGGTDTVFDTISFQKCVVGGSAAHHFDDVFICNALGTENNDFRGSCRVDLLLPNADGAVEEWDLSTGSDSFALIDEATPNSDTDYIESDVPGEITRVGLQDLSDVTHVVFGVQVGAWARKEDAGPAEFRMGMFSDATAAAGADRVLSESYIMYYDIFEHDPDGDIDWTAAAVNAAQAYVEVRT